MNTLSRIFNKTYFILFLIIFYSNVAKCDNLYLGDLVKIQNIGKGEYLVDDNGSAKTAASGKNVWIIRRNNVEFGTKVTSGIFPKLQNAYTGKYITGQGSPIPMTTTTDYNAGEFWTPVDSTNNSYDTVNSLIITFKNTSYPNNYQDVLYSGLKGEISNYWPPKNSNIPSINPAIQSKRVVYFISNAGNILREYNQNVTIQTDQSDDISYRKWKILPITDDNKNFTFDPSLIGKMRTYYLENWVAPTADNFEVKFQASATSDIYVQFSPSMHAAGDKCILLNIGGSSNKLTWIGNGLVNGAFPGGTHTVYGSKISDSIPTGTNWFWIKIIGNLLYYGQSNTIGQNTKGTFTIPNNIQGLKYVSFGGYNATVTYTNISITSPTIIKPVAQFSSSVSGLTATFKDYSLNHPTSWAWDFGDSSSSSNTSTLQNPSHTYTKSGTYNVSLTVSNSGGNSEKTQSVTVTVPPVAQFSSSVSGLKATFTDSSSNNPTSWAWDFGDGSTSTSQNPSHTYTKSGTYTVSLIASNIGGISNATTQSINITNPLDSLSGNVTLDSMLSIINDATFDQSFQGAKGGDLIDSKLVWFFDNRSNFDLTKLANGFNGLFDVAKNKPFLTDTQKQGISVRGKIIVLETGLTTALSNLNSSANKLAAISTFLNNNGNVTNARELRKNKAALLPQ